MIQQLTAHSLKDVCRGTQVIVVANREPYSHERQGNGQVAVMHSSSGVVNAVEPLVAACGGVWVAHGSGTADRESAAERDGLNVPPHEPRYRLRRVWIDSAEHTGFYRGFANEALWPLCHRTHVRPVFRAADFEAYQSVNARFTQAVCDEATTDSPVVLVQDYHFALVPDMLRSRLSRSTVVAFWHIPWPDWQTFEICPWHDRILSGLLGSSIVGLQTPRDCQNFIECVERACTSSFRVDDDGRTVVVAGRRVRVRCYPASVVWQDADAAPQDSRESVYRALGFAEGIQIGVGVDRFDYTKGIEEKCLAVERLLDSRPEFAGRFVFVQLAEPTRAGIPAYTELRARVRSAVERINCRFGRSGYCPILLLEGHHDPADVSRFLRAADLCFVGSLHDGMNLVSKEFVRARDDERGVLVLSRFAGAARELADALAVNPYDVDDTANALAAALRMPRNEQRDRMRRMRRVVSRADAHQWAGQILGDAIALQRQHHTRSRADAAIAAGSLATSGAPQTMMPLRTA